MDHFEWSVQCSRYIHPLPMKWKYRREIRILNKLKEGSKLDLVNLAELLFFNWFQLRCIPLQWCLKDEVKCSFPQWHFYTMQSIGEHKWWGNKQNNCNFLSSNSQDDWIILKVKTCCKNAIEQLPAYIVSLGELVAWELSKRCPARNHIFVDFVDKALPHWSIFRCVQFLLGMKTKVHPLSKSIWASSGTWHVKFDSDHLIGRQRCEKLGAVQLTIGHAVAPGSGGSEPGGGELSHVT